MARNCSGGERAIIAGAGVNHHLFVYVKNADGVFQDCSALGTLGLDLADGASWGEQLDTPVSGGTLTIRRDTSEDTAAPTMGASSINRTALGAYSPLFEKGRAILVKTATTAQGVVPSESDKKTMFVGRIDGIHWQDNPMTVDISDIGAWLADAQLIEPKQYASDTTEVGGGPKLGEVIQAMLADAIPDDGEAVTLYEPAIAPFQPYSKDLQEPGSALAAMRGWAQEIGWDLRYRFDSADAYRFTLFEPPRSKGSPDWVIGPDEYTKVMNLTANIADIRNMIIVQYKDTDGKLQTVTAKNDASIAKYGGPSKIPRVWQFPSSTIRNATDALALANSVLSDLSEADADQEIEMPYFWPLQVGDLCLFRANGDHYDTDQSLAVVSYQHSLTEGEGRTTIQARGKVAGAYRAWLRGKFGQLPVTPIRPQLAAVVHASGWADLIIDTDENAVTVRVAMSYDAPPTRDEVLATPDIDLPLPLLHLVIPHIAFLDAEHPVAYVSVLALNERSQESPLATITINATRPEQYTTPTPTFTPVEVEGTARGGTEEGCMHIPVQFEFNTDFVEIYARESDSDPDAPVAVRPPDLATNSLSYTIHRQPGLITEDDNWRMEVDISTKTGKWRRFIAIGVGPTGLRGDSFQFWAQCIDTGVGPSAPPTDLNVVMSTSGGHAKATLTWVNGDASAFTRIERNEVIIARMAPGVTTLEDDWLPPELQVSYNVHHIKNGQTSDDARSIEIVTDIPKLLPPVWETGYPQSAGYDSTILSPPPNGRVRIKATSPDPLARIRVWMNNQETVGGTYSLKFSSTAGVVDTYLKSNLMGVPNPKDEVRFFYLTATRDGYTDSDPSDVRSATFGFG